MSGVQCPIASFVSELKTHETQSYILGDGKYDNYTAPGARRRKKGFLSAPMRHPFCFCP